MSEKHIADVSKKDTISRQAAISRIQNLISAWNDWNTDSVKERKGLDAALCVLEDMPSAQPDLQPTCNQLATDCISRQAAIDALDQIFDRCEEIEAHLPEGDPDRTGYRKPLIWKGENDALN